MSKDTFKIIAILQICSSLISFVASSAMVIMVRKERGASTPESRIILGLSLSEFLQSFVMITGPFALPDTVSKSWGVGTKGTCQASGFLFTVCMTVVPMYTVFLCFYYFCKLKYRMTNVEFTRKYEKKIHCTIILINILSAFVALNLRILNPVYTLTLCQAATEPVGCNQDPKEFGECDPVSKMRSDIFILSNYVVLNMLSLLAMVVIMGRLFLHARRMKVLSHEQMVVVSATTGRTRTLDSGESNSNEEVVVDEAEGEERHIISPSQGRKRERNASSRTDEATREKAKKLSTLFVNETVLQASCYIGAFCITHVPVFVSNIALVILDGPHPNFFVEVCPYFFYPLGGFFNVLAYTRPKVAYMRRSNPKLYRSRLLCLWKVLKAGGEIPKEALLTRQTKKEKRVEARKKMSSVPFGVTPFGEVSSENHSISLQGWRGSRLDLVEFNDSIGRFVYDENGISFGSNGMSSKSQKDNDDSFFHQYE